MKKRYSLILCLGLLTTLLIIALPDKASAFLVPEVNVSNFVKPVTQYLFDIIKQLITGLIYLMIASTLFNFSVNNSPKLLDLNESNFVQTGLNITTSLADILLIAVFIAVALGTIFNIETINAKKHLIKFFIAALLIHFAPLFVYMVIDIANITMSSIVVGSGDMFSFILKKFTLSVTGSTAAILLTYIAGAVVSGLNGVGTVANIAMVSGFLVMIAFLPKVLIQLLVMSTLTGLLFSFAFFFLTRIFMIQILAVLAPLAILASILPQTKSYFDTWLSWLIGWSFGGILLLFLLTLGINTSSGFIPDDANFNAEGISISGISFSFLSITSYIYWIALAIYMLTVETLCAATIPDMSKKISGAVSGGMGGAGKAIGGGLTSGGKKSNYSNITGRIGGSASSRWGNPSSEPAAKPSSAKDPYDPAYG